MTNHTHSLSNRRQHRLLSLLLLPALWDTGQLTIRSDLSGSTGDINNRGMIAINSQIQPIVRILAIFLLSSLLIACTDSGATPAPTTLAPTAMNSTERASAPSPTAPVPTVPMPATAPPQMELPTPTSQRSEPLGVLPAPVYVLDDGQIVRIATDGVSRTPITNEQPFADGAPAISEFAVSPADGALAYTLLGADSNTLITTDADGGSRRVLLENARLAAPRWSPDGSAIAIQIVVPNGSESSWEPGLWVVSALSGEARLLIASDLLNSPGPGVAWAYGPDSWSPDGRRILVTRTSRSGIDCEAAILEINTGVLTLVETITEPDSPLRAQCSGGAWQNDSTGFLVVVRSPASTLPAPGLYRADASSGVLTPVIAPSTNAGQFITVQSQAVRPDGEIMMLAALTDTPPVTTIEPDGAPPVWLSATGSGSVFSLIHDESYALYGTAIWAPGAAGVLIPTLTDTGGITYRYVSAQGETATIELSQGPTTGIAWGR